MNDCQTYRALVPGYADGELSEEQAAPLRQHLLSCNACRNSAQELDHLGRWFPAEPALEVPEGFAARVAAAAFSGADPVARPQPRAQLRPTAAPVEPVEPGPRLMGFVLTLTSVAAGLLLTLALLMAREDEPQGTQMSAEPLPAILQELDRLNGERGEAP